MKGRRNEDLNIGANALLPPLYHSSPRGQLAVMLLAALRELYVNDGYRTVPKREAIRFIERKKWFAIKDEDREPYPSQRFLSAEPRWHTLIAWARKDSVLRDLISDDTRDAWGLTKLGRDAIDREQKFCKSGARKIYRCFLWSGEFKRFMFPDYSPTARDVMRPISFYHDLQCQDSIRELQQEIERLVRLF